MPNKNTEKKSYKDSLNLPKTDFPIRPDHKLDAESILARWKAEDIYKKAFLLNKGKEKFILHDGPPYANGHIHLGSSYNKMLKDIISKSQRMMGKHVPVTPGWDCHGLPIEFKVAEENKGLSRVETKKACRKYASKWIDIQREEFKALGVIMNWDHPYLTMDPGYEAKSLRAFGQFVKDGFIERKNKTIPWCAHCQTVLATAEIEHKERKDPSIFVPFSLKPEFVDKISPDLKGKDVGLLIWTTTPWTLPLNRAVLLKPKTKYAVLDVDGKLLVVGASLVDKLCAAFGVDKKVLAEFDSSILEGAKSVHPFIDGQETSVILDQSVLVEDGTACVHSAPGCGPEDYEVGIKNNLEIFSPLNPDGTYSEDILPVELAGMPVSEGQIWVIKKLAEKGKLQFKTSLRHPYPHCWRCRNGLIFRATKQWFFDLSKHDVRKKALEEIGKMDMKPETSRKRLSSTIEGRLEWCLSRQRVWGVPIPALLSEDGEQVFTSKELIDFVAKGVEKEGIEYWDAVTVEELKPLVKNLPEGVKFIKEQDILDVWFDSGVSHYSVVNGNAELAYPSDLYIEGKDQHRGWFQSSLLTSVALNGASPTKAVYTHGYTVDEKGHKMSKSLGNVVVPSDVVDKIGLDGLRLWASSIDLKDDPIMSDILVQNVREVFRKIRNNCRFLISNLYDFDFAKDAVPVEELYFADKYALSKLAQLNKEIKVAYTDADFTAVFHKLGDYAAIDLSSFYLDIVKDRLYCDKADSKIRRSAQTTCYYILDSLTRLIAPVLSVTAEIISDHYQKDKTESIHLQNFSSVEDLWAKLESSNSVTPEEWSTFWDALNKMRPAIMKAIEIEREKGTIKHPLEVSLTLNLDSGKEALALVDKTLNKLGDLTGQSGQQFLEELLVVSQVNITDDAGNLEPSELEGLKLKVAKAAGEKCQRCWKYEEGATELCQRCLAIV
jgi:isoleucyl-tRNA synthetase